mgnify:CR=1 FL=1
MILETTCPIDFRDRSNGHQEPCGPGPKNCEGEKPARLYRLENQSAIAQQLGKMGITVSLGWYQQLTVNQLTTAISELLSTPKQRQQMSEKGRQLVDGLGSQRVIEIMEKKGVN